MANFSCNRESWPSHFKKVQPAAGLAVHGSFRAWDAGTGLPLGSWHMVTAGLLPLKSERAKLEMELLTDFFRKLAY